MRYTFSKMSILGCFCVVIGVIFTIQGIIVRCNLANIKEFYSKFEIKNGRYIEYDISKEQLIGMYYAEGNGTIKYGPYCNTDIYSSDSTYIVAINEDSDYFVPLIVAREYQKDFNEMVNSDVTYHLIGKFEKFSSILIYDTIAECMGINNKSEIEQIISTYHQIRVVNLEDERKILHKGLSFLIVGMFILFVTVGRKKVV